MGRALLNTIYYWKIIYRYKRLELFLIFIPKNHNSWNSNLLFLLKSLIYCNVYLDWGVDVWGFEGVDVWGRGKKVWKKWGCLFCNMILSLFFICFLVPFIFFFVFGMSNKIWSKLGKSPMLTCLSTTISAYRRNMIFTIHVNILPHTFAYITWSKYGISLYFHPCEQYFPWNKPTLKVLVTFWLEKFNLFTYYELIYILIVMYFNLKYVR